MFDLFRDIDFDYISKVSSDKTWREDERYLYYSYKNPNYIPWTVIGCIYFLLFTNGWIYSLLLFVFVRYLCYLNNKDLDNDPKILKSREAMRHYRRTFYGEDV